MWRWALVFVVMTSAVAEAGQVRSSFQVGLTITGRVNAPGAIPQSQGRLQACSDATTPAGLAYELSR